MFPISGAERDELKTSAAQSLFETCTLYTSSSSFQDGFGQVHQAYQLVEDVPCGLETRQEEFQDERGQAVVLSGDAVLRLHLDQPIAITDYVLVRGKSYAVDGVFDGLTVRRAVLKIAPLPEGVS